MSKSQLSRNSNLWDHFRKLQWTCALLPPNIIWIRLIVTLTGLTSFPWHIRLLATIILQNCYPFGLMVDCNSPCITLLCLQDNGGSFTRPCPHITPKVMEEIDLHCHGMVALLTTANSVVLYSNTEILLLPRIQPKSCVGILSKTFYTYP